MYDMIEPPDTEVALKRITVVSVLTQPTLPGRFDNHAHDRLQYHGQREFTTHTNTPPPSPCITRTRKKCMEHSICNLPNMGSQIWGLSLDTALGVYGQQLTRIPVRVKPGLSTGPLQS